MPILPNPKRRIWAFSPEPHAIFSQSAAFAVIVAIAFLLARPEDADMMCTKHFAGLALVACLGLTPSAHALNWYHNLPPVEIDWTHSGIDIRVGAGAMHWRQQLQPWWTYFPYEPNLMVQPQTTPYPPWPSNHPGVTGAPAYGSAYGQPFGTRAVYPAPAYGMPAPIHPAGGVPSYWYGR